MNIEELITAYERRVKNFQNEFNMTDRGRKTLISAKLTAARQTLNELNSLRLDFVSKTFTANDMLNAAKYGYEYRHTTSFPDKDYKSNCENNVKQWIMANW